jgi:two-component system, OmpR family, sensor kinase
MRQPISLRRRFTLGGFVLILVLVVALNIFVYLSLRERLMANLDDVPTSRAQLAGEIARQVPLEVLEARFIALGLRAEVHGPAERVILAEPLLDRFENLPPGAERAGANGLVSRDVDFPDGYRITVYASRAGVDATLRRVLTLQALGTLGVLLAAGLVLGRMSRLALRPLNEISATARRIAEVGAGERLDVGDGDPELAAMADAFNEMLEALETAVGDARDSEARSRRFLADAAHQLR